MAPTGEFLYSNRRECRHRKFCSMHMFHEFILQSPFMLLGRAGVLSQSKSDVAGLARFAQPNRFARR
jgi:hypothetical protein